MTTSPIAHPYAESYSGGTVFWLVGCETCGTILNSGHHYSDVRSAREEADRHNAEYHGISVSS